MLTPITTYASSRFNRTAGFLRRLTFERDLCPPSVPGDYLFRGWVGAEGCSERRALEKWTAVSLRVEGTRSQVVFPNEPARTFPVTCLDGEWWSDENRRYPAASRFWKFFPAGLLLFCLLACFFIIATLLQQRIGQHLQWQEQPYAQPVTVDLPPGMKLVSVDDGFRPTMGNHEPPHYSFRPALPGETFQTITVPCPEAPAAPLLLRETAPVSTAR